jgi:hypothetical protein
MGIKENVKKGAITIADAMNRVAPDSNTHAWLTRRLGRLKVQGEPVAPAVEIPGVPAAPKPAKKSMTRKQRSAQLSRVNKTGGN